MAEAPFFSVVIPTMNRPQLLEAAVRTVLWQTFGDFELIISDNSNEELSTSQNRRTVEECGDDPRVRYVRPRNWMNMPDHWEFATRHAAGRYVVMLTDRHVMRPSALQFLYTQIMDLEEDARVISWHSQSAFYRGGIVHTVPFTGAREVLDSRLEISEFARCRNWRSWPLWCNRLPRMLNACCRHDVPRAIRERHGRLFMPLNQDYTCAYLLLAYVDRFTYIDRPLFLSHGDQSNGRTSLMRGISYQALSLDDVDPFAGTPTTLNTVTNSIVRDLQSVKDLVGARFSNVSLDIVGYFMCNYQELMLMEKMGSQADVGSLYTQWRKSVQALPQEQQAQIEQYVVELQKQRASFARARRLTVRLRIDPFYHSITGTMRHIRNRLAGHPVYANVFEAAMQTDHILRCCQSL